MSDITPNSESFDQILNAGRQRRRRPWVLAVVICLGIAALAFSNPRGNQGPTFETVDLEQRDLIATVSATGRLEPVLKVDVGSEISGTMAEVLVDSNDPVRAGQVLARIDTTKLEQQTERSRATLLSAQALLAQAQATHLESEAQLKRFEEVARLSDGRVPSETEMDAARAAELRARSSVEAARASVAEAEAAVRTHKTDLAKSVIRSPIDGIVLSRGIDPGQTVAASFQAPILFTIGQDLGKMDLTVYVSEADVGKVQEGQMAAFSVDAWPDTRFEATVKKISFGSQTVENVVSYEADLGVDNGELKLRPGMTATATIQVAERHDVWAVPNAALRFNPPSEEKTSRGFSMLPRPPQMKRPGSSDDTPGIYVLRQGALTRESVEVGLSDGRWTEIRGFQPQAEDQVVIDMFQEDPS